MLPLSLAIYIYLYMCIQNVNTDAHLLLITPPCIEHKHSASQNFPMVLHYYVKSHLSQQYNFTSELEVTVSYACNLSYRLAFPKTLFGLIC